MFLWYDLSFQIWLGVIFLVKCLWRWCVVVVESFSISESFRLVRIYLSIIIWKELTQIYIMYVLLRSFSFLVVYFDVWLMCGLFDSNYISALDKNYKMLFYNFILFLEKYFRIEKNLKKTFKKLEISRILLQTETFDSLHLKFIKKKIIFSGFNLLLASSSFF